MAHVKTADVLSSWLAQGKPTLSSLARQFGVTRQRIHQILALYPKYRQSAQAVARRRRVLVRRERLSWLLAHPEAGVRQAAAAWGVKEGTARHFGLQMGVEFAPKQYSPQGDTAIIVKLHDEGLRPSEIQRWLSRRDKREVNHGKVYRALLRWRKHERFAPGRWHA